MTSGDGEQITNSVAYNFNFILPKLFLMEEGNSKIRHATK